MTSDNPLAVAPSAAGRGGASPEALAAAVLAVPGVVRLHAGSFGEVATYLPGGKVDGIRLRDDGTHVHVVLRAGLPLGGTAERVRGVVAALVPGPVHVTVEDVEP